MNAKDIVGYRPHQVRRFLRKGRRAWTPGEGPKRNENESSLFPGGQIRHLTSFPDVHRLIGPTPVLPPDVAPFARETEVPSPNEPQHVIELDPPEVTPPACTERSECGRATPGVPIESDPPQTPVALPAREVQLNESSLFRGSHARQPTNRSNRPIQLLESIVSYSKQTQLSDPNRPKFRNSTAHLSSRYFGLARDGAERKYCIGET